MSFKTPFICDRRVYAHKGKWIKPKDDIEHNIFYFVSTPRTLEPSYQNGIEQITETMEITVFGGKEFAKEDIILLETGERFKINAITINYVESNILIRDMLKPRIASTILTLD